MKTISIFSDTHGNKKDLAKAHQIMQEADLVFHLGDGASDIFAFDDIREKTHVVSGNCDRGLELLDIPREKIVEVENCKIFLTHGDLYGVKGGLERLAARAKELGATVCCYGHTHARKICEINGVLMINPGTLYRYAEVKSFCYAVVLGDKLTPTINDKLFLS